MIPAVHSNVWAFDLEWAPDPRAGRLLLDLPEATPDAQTLQAMWQAGGATEADPRPFLKMVQCRVLSVAAVQRRERDRQVEVNLLWMPRNPEDPASSCERAILGTFLDAVGRHRPQLVGFNSRASDLRILQQRGVVGGLAAAAFCERPEKPWQGTDYFARGNPMHVDLMETVSGWGHQSSVSLHEIAVLSGIPGKMDARGEQVADLWLAGRWRDIVQYNCFDALSTYLLWLRMCHFAGHFSTEGYEEEQENVRQMLMRLAESPEGAFLEAYFDEWERLQQAAAQPA